MPDFASNIDKCFFSKTDTCLFVGEVEETSKKQKSKLIRSLAPKHKITAIEFDAAKNINIEDIVQSLYYEVETLIGIDVSKTLEKYSDEKKIFVLAELLKDTAIIFYMNDPVDKELLVQIQRLLLTIKRYTRARIRLICICNQETFDHCIDAGLRLEFVRLYFSGMPERNIVEMKHAVSAEIKLERRGIERFLGDYVELIKLRPRVKSFLGNV